MATFNNISINSNGGAYHPGKALTEVDWADIYLAYLDIIDVNADGKCSNRQLGERTLKSRETCRKAISYFKLGMIPPAARRGNMRRGVGSMKDLSGAHHFFIYRCYLRHPERSRASYVRMFYTQFNIKLSEMFVTRWFKSIGPFKGNMRLTSKFPPNKYSWQTRQLLDEYLLFVSQVRKIRRLVFADEKPFKGNDIYSLVRRDPFTGVVPDIRCDANSRNRYNILAAISMKRDHPICARVIDLNGDAIVFQEFVRECLDEGVLSTGDIFIVDNCTIHCYGGNEYLQEVLWEEHQILMITIPPYHPELNLTELVFRATLTKLRSMRSNNEDFELNDVISEITLFLYAEMNPYLVRSFYRQCGYF